MKKIYFFLAILLVAGFSACEENIGLDVAPPQSNPQEEPQVIEGFTIAIDDIFKSALELTGEEQELQIVKATDTPKLKEGATVVFKVEISDTPDFENVIELPTKSANNATTILSSDLSEAVKQLFNSKAPVARSIYIRSYFSILDGTSASLIPTPAKFGPFSITPFSNVQIEPAYYLIGDATGWDINNLDAYKFSHSGANVYDDPIFTITLQMPAGNFKIVPQSSKNAGSWDGVLGNPVDQNPELEGTLGTGAGFDGAMRIMEGQMVKVTINMLESTYQIQLLGNVEPAYYLIGDVNGWSFDNLADYQFSHSGQSVSEDPTFSIRVQMPAGNFKIVPQSAKDAGSWGGVLGNPIDENPALQGSLGTGDGFGGAMNIAEAQWVKITINMREFTYQIELLGDTPPTMYMIGEEFGGWNWASDRVVEMTPVNGFAGHFWAIRYISAGTQGFKWSPVRDWGSDFYSLGEEIGYTVSDGNAHVAESGMYMVYVDMINGKISVEPAKVYGMGDCFGGWDTATFPFASEDRTMTYTTTGSGELRMYAASNISPVGNDWWRMEFVILDGKIAYRGTEGDQTRVPVDAGKKVTLDFNAGIGTIQ